MPSRRATPRHRPGPARRFDLLIAGIGVGGTGRTTAETLRGLRQVRRIFSLSVHEEYVRSLGVAVTSLDSMYYSGDEDERVYRRIAARIVTEARQRPPIALVDDGHPLLYDDVNRMILDRARRHGVRVRVLPAVSFLDALLVDAAVPFDADGLQIVEASTLVEMQQALNPDFNTLVLQVGWFATSQLRDDHRLDGASLAPLREHLLCFFPPDHRLQVVRVRHGNGDAGCKYTIHLARLQTIGPKIESDCSLFIPRVP